LRWAVQLQDERVRAGGGAGKRGQRQRRREGILLDIAPPSPCPASMSTRNRREIIASNAGRTVQRLPLRRFRRSAAQNGSTIARKRGLLGMQPMAGIVDAGNFGPWNSLRIAARADQVTIVRRDPQAVPRAELPASTNAGIAACRAARGFLAIVEPFLSR